MNGEEYNRLLAKGSKKRKYKNKPCEVDGLKFHSMKEAECYLGLKMLEKAGTIRDLCADKKQLHFPLVVKGFLISTYTPDFRYFDVAAQKTVYADYKGGYFFGHQNDGAMQAYRIRKKLMKALFNIDVVEIQ